MVAQAAMRTPVFLQDTKFVESRVRCYSAGANGGFVRGASGLADGKSKSLSKESTILPIFLKRVPA